MSRFVVVRLSGGLGNQMFQFATAHAVSLRTEQPLYTDLLRGSKALLSGFALPACTPVRPAQAVRAGLAPWAGRKGTRIFAAAARSWGVTRLSPTTFGTFLPAVLDLRGPVVLEGHWQSEKYFIDVADSIRRAFMPRQPLSGRVSRLASQMRDEDSVSVSFRRGDYLTTMPNEDLPTERFYADALAHVSDALGCEPRVYAFSDDREWLEENLERLLPGAVQVSGLISSSIFEELVLHSATAHQIIANSTFSWWAAWLNPSPTKIVVAPSRWVHDWAAPDVVPESWGRL